MDPPWWTTTPIKSYITRVPPRAWLSCSCRCLCFFPALLPLCVAWPGPLGPAAPAAVAAVPSPLHGTSNSKSNSIGFTIFPVKPPKEKRFKCTTSTLGLRLTVICFTACTFFLHPSHFHSFPCDSFSGLMKARKAAATEEMPPDTSSERSWKWFHVLDEYLHSRQRNSLHRYPPKTREMTVVSAIRPSESFTPRALRTSSCMQSSSCRRYSCASCEHGTHVRGAGRMGGWSGEPRVPLADRS